MTLGEPPREDDSIGTYLARTIAALPDRVAITTLDAAGRDRLTFGELGGLAGGLAAAALATSAGGPIVALPADGVELALGLAAATCAGRPFVAVDPRQPLDRIAEQIQIAGAQVAIGTGRAEVPGAVVLRPDEVDPAPYEPIPVGPDATFSVSFTSGSTGQPKPIARTHRWLLDTLTEANLPHHPVPGDHVAMMLSVTGVVTTSMARALLNGLTLSVFDPQASSSRAIAEALREREVTLVRLVPSIMRRLVEAAPEGFRFDTMRVVWCGGELLRWSDIELLRPVLPDTCMIVHQYGSSELGAVAAKVVCHDDPVGTGGVPIGRPVPDLDAWVDAGAGEPAGVGEVGELVVEGARLGIRTGDITPGGPVFEDLGDGRWRFRTGDAVRWRADGDLEHLGRLDRMLKVGGTRLEPATVEDALRRVPGVSDVVAVGVAAPDGETRLVAHVVVSPGAAVEVAELRRVARERLPSAAVPSRFVLHAEPLPLLESGKVDQRALPVPDALDTGRDGPLVPPADELERALVGCVAEVLGLPEVGATDDFFALGGDSLRAQRLCAVMVRRRIADLPPSVLLRAPTVRQLAEIVRGGAAEVWSNLVPLRTEGSRPPLFAFHALMGQGLLYGALADHLGPDQPVYAVQAEALSGRRPRWTTIEQMATGYREQIEARFPEGPYLLFGYSMGGALAFEVARQLLERGRPVAMLVMADTVNSGLNESWLYPRVTVRSVLRGDDRTRRRGMRLHRRALAAGRHVATGLVVRSAFALGRPAPERLRRWHISSTHRRASSGYRPEPLPLRMLMIRSRARDPRPARGWEGFLSEIDIHRIEVGHRDLVREEGVAEVAAILRGEIDRACERVTTG